MCIKEKESERERYGMSKQKERVWVRERDT